MKINKNFLQILFVIVGLAVFSACQSSTGNSGGASGGGTTPTDGYKSLYNAVKSKNTDDIKANMSKATIEFASGVAQMQKKSPEEMFKNGLIQSTLADKLPQIRNERVKENMGAVEAQTREGGWEDVPFVLEDGRWKLAVGDLFKGSYQKPAPSQAETEANNNVPQIVPGPAITNANMIPAPKMPTDKNPADNKKPEANKPEKK